MRFGATICGRGFGGGKCSTVGSHSGETGGGEGGRAWKLDFPSPWPSVRLVPNRPLLFSRSPLLFNPRVVPASAGYLSLSPAPQTPCRPSPLPPSPSWSPRPPWPARPPCPRPRLSLPWLLPSECRPRRSDRLQARKRQRTAPPTRGKLSALVPPRPLRGADTRDTTNCCGGRAFAGNGAGSGRDGRGGARGTDRDPRRALSRRLLGAGALSGAKRTGRF